MVRAGLIVLGVCLVVMAGGYGLFQISKSRTFQFFGAITNRVATNQKVVALTFDDAPSQYSNEVIATLADKKIKATFYMVGGAIEQYPDQAKTIVAAGMEVGNHSYSHQRFLLKSPAFITTEIEKTNQLIRAAGYQGEITFRPPNGKKLFGLPWYLSQHNIHTIMWDVEPDTYLPSNLSEEEKAKFLVQYTVANTQPGSIVLLHPFCQNCGSDRQALGQIIDQLQAKGYRFVTVSELLTYQAQ